MKLSNYQNLQKIGEGTYGVVYKAKASDSEESVAIKQIDLDYNGVPSSSIREISTLKHLDHANIVRLHKVFHESASLYLVFEYIATDLRSFMDLYPEPLQEFLIRKFIYQLLKAVSHCHTNRILHRDLKPQNLLIDASFNLKVADFGLSKAFSLPVKCKTREVVTLWYRAPELLLGCQHYGTPVDLWSIGCIMCELISGEPVFAGDSEIDQIYRIFRKLGTPKQCDFVRNLPYYSDSFPDWPKSTVEFERVGRHGNDLIRKLLEIEPSKRISASEALNHPYFNTY